MDESVLEGIGLFEGLSADERARVAAELREVEHPVGSVVLAEGDLPMTFFVILDGTVTVHRNGVHVADLGRGDFFGEVGVVGLGARNATVIATTPVRAAVLMGWTLREFYEEIPTIAARIAAAVEARRAV